VDSRGVRDAGSKANNALLARQFAWRIENALNVRPTRRGGQQPRACSDLHDGRAAKIVAKQTSFDRSTSVKEAEYDLLCNLASSRSQPSGCWTSTSRTPLSYWYDGHCTAEITAIAASFDPRGYQVWLLGIDEPSRSWSVSGRCTTRRTW